MADERVLPREILENIFVRLPTKPLLRSKCVSKHWYSLISDPKLMKLRSRRMILLPVLPLHAIDHMGSGNEMVKLHFPFGNLEEVKSVTIVGAVNGIVLLVIKSHRSGEILNLYNPFTGEFTMIPKPSSRALGYARYVYGFGYGATTDDIKIVRIQSNMVDSRSCEVFCLKNKSWSALSQLNGRYMFYDFGSTFVNGFFYWIVIRDTHGPAPFIMALDGKKMVFSEILVPHGYIFNNLGKFNGRLCMICIKRNCVEYELKVINEHGFGKSWSTVCLSKFRLKPAGDISNLRVLSNLDDGKFLMLMGENQLIIYDMLKDTYKEVITLSSFGEIPTRGYIEYVESLVSVTI